MSIVPTNRNWTKGPQAPYFYFILFDWHKGRSNNEATKQSTKISKESGIVFKPWREQSLGNSQPNDSVWKIGSVIGKGGSIVKAHERGNPGKD